MRRHFGQCVAEVFGFNMTGLFPLSKGRSAVNKVTVTLWQTGLVVSVVVSLAVGAQEGPRDGPRYENDTSLVRPTDYREWTFLSSGLSMTYEEPGQSAQPPREAFQNVFVNPSSYRGFMQTGKWPNGTIFVLEFRQAGSEVSINRAGRFQTDLVMLEAEVKDARFPDGWAFYNFGFAESMADVAAPLAGDRVARCIECHTQHTAVERTFVQFYPTLLEVARRMGTLKPGF